MEQLFDDPVDGIDPVYQVMTVKEIAYDLFESKEMRTYFMRSAMSSAACFPGNVMHVGDVIHQIMIVFALLAPASPVGGTHALAHALQKTLSEMGGKFFVHHEVDKILLENSAAKGVRLVDRTEIEARKLVVSNADPYQTLFRFVSEEYISSQLARRVRNFSYDRGNLFWAHFAMHELPQWKAADFNPDCLRSSRIDYMPNDPETLAEKHQMECFSHGIPEKLIYLGRHRQPGG